MSGDLSMVLKHPDFTITHLSITKRLVMENCSFQINGCPVVGVSASRKLRGSMIVVRLITTLISIWLNPHCKEWWVHLSQSGRMVQASLCLRLPNLNIVTLEITISPTSSTLTSCTIYKWKINEWLERIGSLSIFEF